MTAFENSADVTSQFEKQETHQDVARVTKTNGTVSETDSLEQQLNSKIPYMRLPSSANTRLVEALLAL